MKLKMKLKMKDIVRYLGLVIILFVFVNSVQKIYERKPIIEGLFGGDSDSDSDSDSDEDEDDDSDDSDDSDDEDDFSGKEKKRIKKAAKYIDKKLKGKKFKKKVKKDNIALGKTFAGIKEGKKRKEVAKSYIMSMPSCAKGISAGLKQAAGGGIASKASGMFG
jgi:hypothetical protein